MDRLPYPLFAVIFVGYWLALGAVLKLCEAYLSLLAWIGQGRGGGR